MGDMINLLIMINKYEDYKKWLKENNLEENQFTANQYYYNVLKK